MPHPDPYHILVPSETLERASNYLDLLYWEELMPGDALSDALSGVYIEDLTPYELIGKLFDTKRPQIYAESAVAGDGSDWSPTELGLLGDVSVAVPVTIFDDGRHHAPTPHDPPFQGTLIYTPGALLANGRGIEPADWSEVADTRRRLWSEGLYHLYSRRLEPVLRYINDSAARPRSALVTIPGLGCGQFAGPFRGELGVHLQSALERILLEFGYTLPNIRAVYFDPYDECTDARREIHGISFMVRPLRSPGNAHKPQLCRPETYQDPGDDFSDCSLYSIVAWDPVSWPGNDFFVGSRATDDGVKAAATDSMRAITGVEGRYDRDAAKYLPPAPFRTWGEVVEDGRRRRGLRLWRD